MKFTASSFLRQRLDRTVRVLCPLVEERVASRSTIRWSEYDLRRELVGCILGSQVRHESAVAATCNLAQAGLLDDEWWQTHDIADFEPRVFAVLAGRDKALRHRSRYRFPRVRSKQLSLVRDALALMPLLVRLSSSDDSKMLRQCLMSAFPGLGPKQASMFLRNTGTSFDLAILDTHVLRFIEIQDLAPGNVTRVNTVRGYERAEQALIAYAHLIGYPIGYLDFAIWVTMRAAKELEP